MQRVEGMRPGRPEDLDRLAELWREEVRQGRMDRVPGGAWLESLMRGLDWEARTRVVERDGRLEAALLVFDRVIGGAAIARLEFAGDPAHTAGMLGWGVALGRAAGARAAQVWRPRGDSPVLPELGFRVVRPFWRMDRPGLEDVPEPPLPSGYRLVTDHDSTVPIATWTGAFNESFADHWQHANQEVEEFERRRARSDFTPGLQVLALAGDGTPAAIVIGSVETYHEDPRPQPVGLVQTVGTIPAHRRRGLALSLTADVVRRLRAAGARSASLYVDGKNPTRAFDVYRKLGFEVVYEFEIWEVALAA
jgi:mycothiol synthase